MSTQPTGDLPQATAAPINSEWASYIGAFAGAIGKQPEEVATALKGLAGEPGSAAIEVLASDEYSSFSDIEEALRSLGVAKGVLKKAVSQHLRKAPAAASNPAVSPVAGTVSLDILPPVPDDDAWLAALKTGGVLKVTPNNVICGMRAALASRSGLFDLPSRLTELMESHAESLSEPVGSDYFELNDLLTRRNYAEIFSALGIDGRKYASVKRKGELVRRLDEVLWPALLGFQSRLKGWVDAWQQSFNNPGAAMGFIAAAISGRGGALPPGMTEAPATDVLHDAADTVINDINRCFAGVGIPVAMAMAYDAQCIKKVLENPNLPIHIGAANRDMMLKLLGVDVAPDYVRLERNISRYALAVMEYPKVTADAELTYLSSLLMLGSQIPWEKLGSSPRRPNASRLPAVESDEDEDVRPPRRPGR